MVHGNWVIRTMLGLAVLTVGCREQRPNATPTPGPSVGVPLVSVGPSPLRTPGLGLSEVVGTVRAPGYLVGSNGATLRAQGTGAAGVIGMNGSGVVAGDGAGVIGMNGSGLQARSGQPLRLQQADDQPLRAARVFLADAAGQPLPRVAAVATDASGRYRLLDVPPGSTYVVVSEIPMDEGKTAQFRTLVKVSAAGATAPLDPATTLVTLNVLEGEAGKDLPGVNPAVFQAAVDAAGRSLTAETMPDFSDRAAMRKVMNRLLEEVSALREVLGEVRKDLAEIKDKLDRLAEAVGPRPGAGGNRPGPLQRTWTTALLAGSGEDGGAVAARGSEGPGVAARLGAPSAVAVLKDGTVVVADGGTNRILRIDANGIVSTVHPPAVVPKPPVGLAVDTRGVAFVSDGVDLRWWSPSLPFSVVSVPVEGTRFAPLPLLAPEALAVAPSGTAVYAVGKDSHAVQRWRDGQRDPVTWVGDAATAGLQDGKPDAARFSRPAGLALDGAGNLYVADTGNHAIRKVSPEGLVSTLVGGAPGFADGKPARARLNGPTGLAVDAVGNVYVADTGNHAIRLVSPLGEVSTLAGTGKPGYLEGTGKTAMFRGPRHLCLGAGGTLYVADTGNFRIRKLVPPTSPAP